jgi:hypothetical protein
MPLSGGNPSGQVLFFAPRYLTPGIFHGQAAKGEARGLKIPLDYRKGFCEREKWKNSSSINTAGTATISSS